MVSALSPLGGLAVAVGIAFAALSVPSVASADPADDAGTTTDSVTESVTPTDPDANAAGSPGGGDATTPAVDPTPAGGEPSESEVTIGGGGPEVVIRSSGGYDADNAPSTAHDATAASTTAEQPSSPPAEPGAPTVAADVEPGPTPTGLDRARRREPVMSVPAQPVGSGVELIVTGPPHVEAVAAPAEETVTTRVLAAPATPAAPTGSDSEALSAPEGVLSAATAFVSGVLNALFVPTNGPSPDSPVIWAVLGLVRRQFNGPSADANEGPDPRRTSRTFGGDEQRFTVVTDRYAYVIDRAGSAVTVVDVGTGAVVDTPVASDQLVGAPVMSPDGSTVFFTAAHNGGVYAVAAAPGAAIDVKDVAAQSTPIIVGGYVGPNRYYVPDGGLTFSPDGALLYVSRQHAQIVSGLFMPADGDVVVIGNDPANPSTYLQVIDGHADVVA